MLLGPARRPLCSRRWSGLRLVAGIVVLLVALGYARPAAADVSDPVTITGITLASLGGAATIVSGVGSLIFIANLENSGGWGWLSLLSGAATGAGGIVLVNHESAATAPGTLAIVFGALSIVAGIAGLSLESPEAKASAHAWLGLSPTWIARDGGGTLALQGVF